jgi:hypothetical protein
LISQLQKFYLDENLSCSATFFGGSQISELLFHYLNSFRMCKRSIVNVLLERNLPSDFFLCFLAHFNYGTANSNPFLEESVSLKEFQELEFQEFS